MEKSIFFSCAISAKVIEMNEEKVRIIQEWLNQS